MKFPAGTARDPAGHAATIANLSGFAAPRSPGERCAPPEPAGVRGVLAGAGSPTSVDAIDDAVADPSLVAFKRDGNAREHMTAVEIEQTFESHCQNPDLSGALYVLELLDDQEARACAAEPAAGQQAAPESETGWRRASVDDYGRAMREALEELAESDRREVQLFQSLYAVTLKNACTAAIASGDLEDCPAGGAVSWLVPYYQ